MNVLIQAVIRIISLTNELLKVNKLWAAMFVTFCFTAESIANPQGAINFWMCAFIDLFADNLPPTRDDYKISAIIASFSSNYPFIGLGIIMEVMSTLLGMLSLYVTVKIIKFARG